MVEFIYKSGQLASERVLKPEQLWSLLEAADMYLLPALVAFCTHKLSAHLKESEDERELVTMVKQAKRLPIFEEVRLAAIRSIKAGLGRMVKSKVWLELPKQ